ncbi:hypothetical protein GCM10010289_79750 [Streptomyces violascens]|nr:hypothetical protein GCM10010289_79750 [Streptomyces violascens]
MPTDIGHREKWPLALDILDDLTAWGVAPRVVLADTAYRTNAAFRSALTQRGLGYVLSVRSDVTAPPSTRCPRHPLAKAPTDAGPSPATARHS